MKSPDVTDFTPAVQSDSTDPADPAIDQVRNLLFGKERQAFDRRIAELSGQIDRLEGELGSLRELKSQVVALEGRFGDDEATTQTIADAFPAALAASNKRDPSGLSMIISPLIVTGIKQQIKNSSDDLVEVMYPITGRMVTASVKNSIQVLSDNINKQFETTLSPKGLIAAVRARATGRPASDFLMAGSMGFTIKRAIVLEKGSGKVVNTWYPPGSPDAEDQNLALVSGLLASLNNLAEEAFDASAGGIRTLDLDGRQIIVRRSVAHMLILEVSGVASPSQQATLDAVFERTISRLESHGVEMAFDELYGLGSEFGESDKTASPDEPTPVPEAKKTRRWSPIAIGAVAAMLLLLAWPVWKYQAAWRLDSAVQGIQESIAGDRQLIRFPIAVVPDYQTGRISISGLIPHDANTTALYGVWRKVANGRELDLSFSRVVTAKPNQ